MFRNDDEESEAPKKPEAANPLGAQIQKKFLEQRKIFLWGAVETETARGRDHEFDRIELIGSTTGLGSLDGPHVDYLRPVLDAYTDV